VSADVPSGTADDFAHMWAWFATHCHDTSPLYERISLAVAGDRALLEHLRTVPPSGQLPPALLAAVRYLVLDGADHALAAINAGTAQEDPGPLFLDFWRTHRDAVDHILATRHIQTKRLWPLRSDRPGADLGGLSLRSAAGADRRGCERRVEPAVRQLPDRIRLVRRDRARRFAGQD
jgi:hypothetical protein